MIIQLKKSIDLKYILKSELFNIETPCRNCHENLGKIFFIGNPQKINGLLSKPFLLSLFFPLCTNCLLKKNYICTASGFLVPKIPSHSIDYSWSDSLRFTTCSAPECIQNVVNFWTSILDSPDHLSAVKAIFST